MAKLYFYFSAMNAGKTTTLLQSSYNYQERGMDTVLYTTKMDDRVAVGKIGSRIGLQADAEVYDKTLDLYEDIKKRIEQNPKIKCIFVDECHFLDKAHVKQLFRVTIDLKVPVLCYGLRTDFLGEPFESSKYLLAWADVLNEIKTICHCGRKATMNLRLDEHGKPTREGDQYVVGGNERYVAVCREHFLKGEVE